MKNIKLLVGVFGVMLFSALPVLACISTDTGPATPIDGLFGIIIVIFSLAALVGVIFSPYLVFLWYINHGGKKRSLKWLALGLPLLVLVSFFMGLWYLYPFSLLYLLLAPFISIFLYHRCGGKKHYWYWGVLVIFWAFFIKGITSLVMGCTN